jgi:hypothetical protein
MKTGPDGLATTKNEYGSAEHENGTRLPQYRRKRVRRRKTWKRDPTPSVPPKTCPGAQNLKTGAVALGTAEPESGCAKHENWVPTPSVPPKRSLGTQNKKTGPDALGTAEDESGRAKHENGPNALGTAENEWGRAKLENGNRRPQYRGKRVRARKT